ncbi:hypothetical protein O6P37_14555 [Mycobacterium sp. CPCC 205372]|uniref:DUF7159 domain-containing protein n=1 Tax=Mycobacterium hippophais TaxID=3016340 RepID=A0ABT4PU80_9MYCO|nr:hypothetical protein [Mycobacterium hippophais]MCZ8380090.1 hypothetical protein [Mycobacterium hippophais]
MDIVLGVSMTPTTVRMVLVEGEKADGAIVDHDVFDITATEGSATSSAADQVVAAVLGTKESAAEGGHYLKSTGVTWSDHAEASVLRETLTARGIDDVMLVSEGHAAASLAQAVGRAVGYATTALLFIDRDTATLSVVQTDDGSVVKVLSRSLHSDDAMAVLTEMAAAVDAQDSAPDGMFVVGSGVDVTSVKAHLEHIVSLPVSAPDESALALARGAALASAHAPALEASTVGLAYSQDPDDGTTAGSAYVGLAAAATQMRPASDPAPTPEDFVAADVDVPADESRKPFLLVGSALTSVFVVGVVALAISLAVSIRPTADQRPSPAQSAIVPSITQAPAAPAPVPEVRPVQAPPAAPPPEVIKAPVQVVRQAPVQQAPPRQVYVEPAAPPPAPAPAAPPPAPAPPPAAPAPVIAPPAALPPPVVVYPRPRYPVFQPPRVYDPPKSPWTPPWTPPWQNDDPPRGGSDWPQTPQQPQYPQYPQYPQTPRQPSFPFPGSGSDSGSRGDYGDSGSRGRGDYGDSDGDRGSSGADRGSSGGNGGSPFWPFPSLG